jgi:hypothetical protein
MKDPALRSVSSAARGLWIDLLCLMFEAPRRGYLELNPGQPLTPKQISRMTGLSTKEVQKWSAELKSAGVLSVSENGIIFSRRMVRDEDKRLKAKEFGKRGGNPALVDRVNPPDNGEAKAKQTPSISSSSSSSISVSPLNPPKGGKAFRPPTLDEVKAYCLERGNRVDPETFRDFYEAKGWKVGAQPMKDWKAAVRTWEKSENTRGGRGGGNRLTFAGLEGDFHDGGL